MDDIVCLEDLEKYAQKHLEKSVYDYYSCGANSEQTLQENGDAFKRYSYLLKYNTEL